MLRYLILPLFSFALVSGTRGEEHPNRQAAANVIIRQIGSPILKKTMLEALNRHPDSTRWSGCDKKQVFGIVVMSFTDQRRRIARYFTRTLSERGCEIEEANILHELENLAANMELEEMPDSVDSEVILLALRLLIVCSNRKGGVTVYNPIRRMMFEISDIDKLTRLRMVQMVGEEVSRLILDEHRSNPEGLFTLGQVKKAIAQASHLAPNEDSIRKLGQGIHAISDSELIIVNGSEAYLFNISDGSLQILESACVDNIVICFGTIEWCSALPEKLEQMSDEGIPACFETLVNFIAGDRNWGHPWDARIIAALVVATFIQDALVWRPLVGIVGPTGSGKTWLFRKVLMLFGRLALSLDSPTAAGLRQILNENKMPATVDEFDSCPPGQIQKILELLRTAGHGGTIVRGSQNHEAVEFHIRHLIWLAGIHLGMFKEQDFNRFIRLSIPRLEIQHDTQTTELSQDEIEDLSGNLVALALRILPAINSLTETLSSTSIPDVPHRMVQNYAVPAAVYAVATHGMQVSDNIAEAVLREMLAGREMPEILQSGTEQELLNDILYTKIPMGFFGLKFVKEIIGELRSTPMPALSETETLEKHGLKVYRPRDAEEPFLFIEPKLVSKYLLKETAWAKMELDPILQQLPGAVRTQQRLGNGNASDRRPRGIAIPLSTLAENANDEMEETEDTNG